MSASHITVPGIRSAPSGLFRRVMHPSVVNELNPQDIANTATRRSRGGEGVVVPEDRPPQILAVTVEISKQGKGAI